MRDVGRIDFRIGEDGRIYFLEVNALPSLEPGAGLFAAAAREGLDYGETLHAIVESAASAGRALVVKPGGRASARPGRSAAHRVHLQHQAGRHQGRQRRRGRVRLARDHRRDPRAPWRATGTRSCCSRPTASCPRALMQTPGRPGVQHRRGRRRAQPRGRRCRRCASCSASPTPASDCRHAGDRARQGAGQAGPAAARDPDRRVPGDGDRARAAVVDAEVPAHRQAERRGLVEGGQRVRRRWSTTRRRCAPWSRELIDKLPPAGAGRGVHPRARVHRRPARRPPPARAAADGDPVQGQVERAAGLRLRGQAGVGEARLLPVPGAADADRAQGDRASRAARPSRRSTAATSRASTCA